MFLSVGLISRVLVFCLALVYAFVLSDFINFDFISLMPTLDPKAIFTTLLIGGLSYVIFLKAKF